MNGGRMGGEGWMGDDTIVDEPTNPKLYSLNTLEH